MKKTDMTVPMEILNQLGGKMFIAMTGTKNLSGDEKSLQMKLIPNKSSAKYLTITLNSMDTYKMEFTKISKGQLVTVTELDNIYNDQLQEIFTSVTGLYTKMGTLTRTEPPKKIVK